MKLKLILKEEARLEIIDAYQYYESTKIGLEDIFLNHLDRCFDRILGTTTPVSHEKDSKSFVQCSIINGQLSMSKFFNLPITNNQSLPTQSSPAFQYAI
jgi:hypothetical protein